MGWPVGTKLFFVPIRFWEIQEPETGHVVEHNVCGTVIPDGEGDDRFTYVYHDGYGHTVYMQRPRCFTTHAAAVAEALRLKVERDVANAAEFEAWWNTNREKIFPGVSVQPPI